MGTGDITNLVCPDILRLPARKAYSLERAGVFAFAHYVSEFLHIPRMEWRDDGILAVATFTSRLKRMSGRGVPIQKFYF